MVGMKDTGKDLTYRFDRLWRVIDLFISRKLMDDPEQVARLRLAVLASIGIFIFAAPAVFSRGHAGGDLVVVVSFVVIALGCSIFPLLSRLGVSLRVSTILLLVYVNVLVPFVAYFDGFFPSPILFWYAVFPAGATLILGRYEGLAVAVVSLAGVISSYLILPGFDSLDPVTADAWKRVYLVSGSASIAALTLMMWAYQSVLVRGIDQYARAMAALEEANDQLAASRSRLATVVEGVNDGVWEWDVTTNSLECSDLLGGILGVDDVGQLDRIERLLTFIHADDRDVAVAGMIGAIESQDDLFSYEVRVLPEHGSNRWVRVRGKITFDRTGIPSRVVGTVTDITTTKLIDDRLGIPNQMYFEQRLKESIDRLKDSGDGHVVVIRLRVVRLAAMRTGYGEMLADAVIHTIHDRLQLLLDEESAGRRIEYQVSAVPDGSFLLLLEGSDISELIVLARSVNTVGDMELTDDPHEIRPMLASALSVAGPDSEVADLLIRLEAALQDRGDEQGLVIVSDDYREQITRQIEIEKELRRAIDNAEFFPVFQPILDIGSGEVVAGEMLIRWEHPVRGELPPIAFLPDIERARLMDRICDWTIEQALFALSYTRQIIDLGESFYLSVNITSEFLTSGSLLQTLQERTLAFGIEHRRLCLEVTEAAIIRDKNAAARVLFGLNEAGFSTSLDDFGTGYSALSYLSDLPFGHLKIDREFVERIRPGADNERSLNVLSAIADVATRLDMRVIVEGVETEFQLEIAQRAGCEFVQGYYYAKPMRIDDFINFVQFKTKGRTSGQPET